MVGGQELLCWEWGSGAECSAGAAGDRTAVQGLREVPWTLILAREFENVAFVKNLSHRNVGN